MRQQCCTEGKRHEPRIFLYSGENTVLFSRLSKNSVSIQRLKVRSQVPRRQKYTEARSTAIRQVNAEEREKHQSQWKPIEDANVVDAGPAKAAESMQIVSDYRAASFRTDHSGQKATFPEQRWTYPVCRLEGTNVPVLPLSPPPPPPTHTLT